MAGRAWLTGLPSVKRKRESRSRIETNDSRSERHRGEQDYSREPRTHGAIRYQSLTQLHDFTLQGQAFQNAWPIVASTRKAGSSHWG
jgi:hypothetical protein